MTSHFWNGTVVTCYFSSLGAGEGEAVMSQLGSSYCSFTMLMLKLHFTVFSTVFLNVLMVLKTQSRRFQSTVVLE